MTAAAAARQVTIESELPDAALIWADAGQYKEVVAALLDNAIRFSPVAGAVTMKLDGDASHWCLTVVDQGEGIDPVLVSHLFEVFTQPDISHHSHGQGLNLARAQHIVPAHQGTIRAESAKGSGTAFVVRLKVEG